MAAGPIESPHSRARWRRLAAIVAVAAALPYLSTLGAPLLPYDDPVYITGQDFWSEPTLANLWSVISRPVFANYQPLHLASYWLDRWLWGPSIPALRATQVVLYALSAAALVSLARRLALPPAGAAFAGLVFAWHPTHVECVAWVSQRKDVLFLLLMLLSLNTWLGPTPRALDARDAPATSARRRLAAVALFALALAAKTTAVVLVPLLGLIALLRGRLRADAPWLASLGALAASGVLLARAAQESSHAIPPALPLAERLVWAARALAWYVRQAVLPLELSPGPPLPSADLPLAEWTGLLALALAVAAVAVAWRRGARAAAALGLWFFLALLPTSGIVPFAAYVHDRYLFAPSVALALLAGALLVALGRRLPRVRRLVTGGAGIVAMGLLLHTAPYARAWSSPQRLFQWELRQNPRSWWVIHALAGPLLQDPLVGKQVEAAVRAAHARTPDQPQVAMLMAEIYSRDGEQDRARAALERTASESPAACVMLAEDALYERDLERAARFIALARGHRPHAPQTKRLVGHLAFARGSHAEAAAAYAEALEGSAAWASDGWTLLALAERAGGRRDAAAAAAERAAPARRAALLAHLALDAGDAAAAAALLDSAGADAEANLVRARLARAGGRADLARLLVRQAESTPTPWPPGRIALEVELRDGP